ncbi:hypothetical protein PILCRDRAFT_828464 [Piloderma croceum F 1598]|uniref:Uncharacterized protein n=1 Tax=Piloderma croceum (strain F 1598) TaxID=765440 RepID=A0A0C3AK02_PILCF|nr:hypothetical protein PILCRDRAFT_828464 [Piloderma croceum F 1598]
MVILNFCVAILRLPFLSQNRIFWPCDLHGPVDILYSATCPEIVEQNLSGKYVVPCMGVGIPATSSRGKRGVSEMAH